MKWKPENRYFKIGLTAFLVIAACLLFYFLIFHAGTVGTGLKVFFGVMNPIIYGFVIAYILNPQFQLIENIFIKIVSKTKWHPKKGGRKAIRIICVAISSVICLLVIYALISQIIPELIKSIHSIIVNFDQYVINVREWINNTFNNQSLDDQTNQIITNVSGKISTWLDNTISPLMNSFIGKIGTSLMSMLVFFKDALLGFIVSIYVLIEKDSIKARFNRLIYAIWPIHTGNRILRNLRFVDEKFGGFLIGKIIDSTIVGILCYIGTSLMQIPYALLISVIVGVTDIIPFFGPFIGAIPSAILIFVVNPWAALYFCIYILVLQQIDGNLIAPKILGGSVGVSSFLVLISIIIAGGFFGPVGMIIGVPVCAIIVAVIQSFVIRQDDKKQIPNDVSLYTNLGRINAATRTVEEKKPLSEEMSLYDRIKYRSEKVRSYDYPVEDNEWDWTKEKFDESESSKSTDERDERESGEDIFNAREKARKEKEAEYEEQRRKARAAKEEAEKNK